MSDPSPLRTFVFEALADLGASVSQGESLVWVRLPETVRSELETPAAFPIAFSPVPAGEFDAELVALGSYFLEKLVALASRRGRWDAARFEDPGPGWVGQALSESGLGPATVILVDPPSFDERVLFLMSFRVSLVSDEKRETFHFLAVSPSEGSAWEVAPATVGLALVPSSEVAAREDLDPEYRLASNALREKTRDDLETFRSNCLRLLEEEVRRIFGYFDRTIESIRKADPEESTDLIRAIQAERDRRLTETLERFDPKASAALCSIRAIRTPTAQVRIEWPDRNEAEVTLDAWSRHVGGLVCGTCATREGPWNPQESGMQCRRCAPTLGASARPRGRPRSGIPPPGTRAGRALGRSSRGSTERSRSASARRRGP